jgi:hypothetical protein
LQPRRLIDSELPYLCVASLNQRNFRLRLVTFAHRRNDAFDEEPIRRRLPRHNCIQNRRSARLKHEEDDAFFCLGYQLIDRVHFRCTGRFRKPYVHVRAGTIFPTHAPVRHNDASVAGPAAVQMEPYIETVTAINL